MFRDQFLAHDGIYLLSHSVGLMPLTAKSAAEQAFFQPWQHADQQLWTAWLAAIDHFRQALARLLHSPADNFCPQSNISSALTKVIHALPGRNGNKQILLCEKDFPNIGFVLKKAEVLGVTAKFIPASEDTLDMAVWDKYLGDDTYAALLTQVYSNTGQQAPLAELLALLRQRGIVSIIDAAQAVGILPIDLQALQPDFLLGSCLKWLCGGPGAAFLWVNPEIVQQCEPIDVGWFSHRDPMAMNIRDFHYADNALRFWGGTPSILPFVIATCGIELLDDIGIERIRRHNQQLAQQLIDAIDDQYIVSPLDASQRSGTLIVNFGEQQPAIEKQFQQAGIHCDSRSSGMRLSPHIYNSSDEMQRVIACIDDCL